MIQADKLTTAALSATHRGIDLEFARQLVATGKVSTPALVLQRSAIRDSMYRLAEALPGVDIHYAVKSNNHPAILAEVRACGGNFDVCASGEIDDVMRTGIEPSTLIHSHPIKSTEELDAAVSKGVEMFVVDNPDEVDKFCRYPGKRLKVLIRFRVDVEATPVVNLQYKFGCRITEVLSLAQRIKDAGHDFYGLTFHVGSQCIYTDNYTRAIGAAGQLIRQLDETGFATQLLDIGGGYPVPYETSTPTIEELAGAIRAALTAEIRPGIRIVCEPGRFVSAGAVSLICSVIGRAERDKVWWYYLDDGLYSTFSGMVYDQCRYPVLTERNNQARRSVLSGPTCDSFDVMYDGIMLPKLELSDLILFPMTGAYCSVSGSHFNSLRRPRYLVLE